MRQLVSSVMHGRRESSPVGCKPPADGGVDDKTGRWVWIRISKRCSQVHSTVMGAWRSRERATDAVQLVLHFTFVFQGAKDCIKGAKDCINGLSKRFSILIKPCAVDLWQLLQACNIAS